MALVLGCPNLNQLWFEHHHLGSVVNGKRLVYSTNSKDITQYEDDVLILLGVSESQCKELGIECTMSLPTTKIIKRFLRVCSFNKVQL